MPKKENTDPEVETVWQDAKKIYEAGLAIPFMLATFHLSHVGDQSAAVSLILSYASKYIESCRGIHASITATKGSGKTHAAETVLKQIPVDFKSEDELSDRAIYYFNVNEGTVILLDDQELSIELQSSIKRATSDNRRQSGRKTVINQKGERKVIPARTIWWFVKTTSSGDEQVLDRCFNLTIDEDDEQRKAILEYATLSAMGQTKEKDEILKRNEHICREIWSFISPCDVVIPYANHPQMQRILKDLGNRDMFLFLDIIKCFALLNNRSKKGDVIVADLNDAMHTIELFWALEMKTGDQSLKLTKLENDILKVVQSQPSREEWTVKELMEKIPGVTYQDVFRALNGRDVRGTHYPGLLDKVPRVSRVQKTTTDLDDSARRSEMYYIFSALAIDFHNFSNVVEKKADQNLDIFSFNIDIKKKYIYNVHKEINRAILDQFSDQYGVSLSLLEIVEKHTYIHISEPAKLTESQKKVVKSDLVFSTVVENGVYVGTSAVEKWFDPRSCVPVEGVYECTVCAWQSRHAKAYKVDPVNKIYLCDVCYANELRVRGL